MSEVPSASRARNLSSAGQLLGALAILGAASGAISSFIVKLQYRDENVPPSTAPKLKEKSVGAVIVLGLACTALTFMLYYQLIAEVGGGGASLGNYLTPIVVLFYWVILLGEPLTRAGILGPALISRYRQRDNTRLAGLSSVLKRPTEGKISLPHPFSANLYAPSTLLTIFAAKSSLRSMTR